MIIMTMCDKDMGNTVFIHSPVSEVFNYGLIALFPAAVKENAAIVISYSIDIAQLSVISS